MNRQEHLQWSKQRALEYVDLEQLDNAVASLMSDFNKHPKLRNHMGIELTMMLLANGNLRTQHEMRKHIEGFN